MHRQQIGIALMNCGVLLAAGTVGGFVVYYFASPNMPAPTKKVVSTQHGKVNASDSDAGRGCLKVPWEVTEFVNKAEKMLQQDYEKTLQHQIHKLKEEMKNTTVSLCETLTHTQFVKVDIQQKAAQKKTEERIVVLVDEAVNRVLLTLETKLQETKDKLDKRQDEMDQRLALEPQIMEIRGFVTWDMLYPILVLQVLLILYTVCTTMSRVLSSHGKMATTATQTTKT